MVASLGRERSRLVQIFESETEKAGSPSLKIGQLPNEPVVEGSNNTLAASELCETASHKPWSTDSKVEAGAIESCDDNEGDRPEEGGRRQVCEVP